MEIAQPRVDRIQNLIEEKRLDIARQLLNQAEALSTKTGRDTFRFNGNPGDKHHLYIRLSLIHNNEATILRVKMMRDHPLVTEDY